MDDIVEALKAVARGDAVELDPFLHEVESHIEIPNSNSVCHCRVIALGGNGLCRLADLMQYLQHSLIDYAIPRSQIKQAFDYYDQTGSSIRIGRIAQQARGLFADVEKSGEGGELLLYLLAERFLGLPQLICKMDLKTSPNVHFHGSDGLHAGPGLDDNLALYWCESKIYSTFTSALAACFDSIVPLLTDANAFESRDLQLLGKSMDLDNPQLEAAIKKFLDPGTALFNSVEYRGLCLVGFDSDLYPGTPNTKTLHELSFEAAAMLGQWTEAISDKAVAHSVESYYIHVFCLPVPSAKDFRAEFRAAFGAETNVNS